MSIFGAIVTYIVVWWIVLFTVLPWGVKSQIEAEKDEIVKGSDFGAPKTAYIGRKLFITTLIAFLLWGFFAFLFYTDIITLNSVI